MSYSAVRPEPPHNNRNSYQTGSCPGFVLGMSLVALLLGLFSLSPAMAAQSPVAGAAYAPPAPDRVH